MFFDGASKGNPGVAEVEGVILDPKVNTKVSYAWNIGTSSNNQVEAYATLRGIQIVVQHTLLQL